MPFGYTTFFGKMWRWLSNASFLILISLVLSFVVVSFFSKEGPIVIPVGPVLVRDKVIPYGGELVYTGTMLYTQSCPGERVMTFLHSPPDGQSVIVTTRQILISHELVDVAERTRYFQLPDAVFPGKWTVTIAIESRCPLEQRMDEIASFEIEVTK